MDTLCVKYLHVTSNAEKKRQLEIRDKLMEDSWIHCVLNISMLLAMLRRRDSWRLEISGGFLDTLCVKYLSMLLVMLRRRDSWRLEKRSWRILGHPSSLIVKGEE